MTRHGDKSSAVPARSRRRLDDRGIASFALLWKVGAILPITVLGAAMLVNADGDAADPRAPGPQVSEAAVEPLTDAPVLSPTPLRRAVRAVTPPPVPVTAAQDAADADSGEVGFDPAPDAPATSDQVRQSTPKPSPTRPSSRPPGPSPSPTPEEAREQCIEQGAVDLAACVEDLAG